jgi:hypothetical protein
MIENGIDGDEGVMNQSYTLSPHPPHVSLEARKNRALMKLFKSSQIKLCMRISSMLTLYCFTVQCQDLKIT